MFEFMNDALILKASGGFESVSKHSCGYMFESQEEDKTKKSQKAQRATLLKMISFFHARNSSGSFLQHGQVINENMSPLRPSAPWHSRRSRQRGRSPAWRYGGWRRWIWLRFQSSSTETSSPGTPTSSSTPLQLLLTTCTHGSVCPTYKPLSCFSCHFLNSCPVCR